MSEGGSVYQLQLAGNYAGETFQLHQDSDVGTLITLSAAPHVIAIAQQGAELLPTNAAQHAPIGAASASPPPAAALPSPAEHPIDVIEHSWLT